MHVVRHDHVSHQQKLIPLANLSQCVHEYVSRPNRPQQGQPPVTAEGEKVKISAAVVTLELLGYKAASKIPRVTPTRGAPLSLLGAVKYGGGILQSMLPVKREDRR